MRAAAFMLALACASPVAAQPAQELSVEQVLEKMAPHLLGTWVRIGALDDPPNGDDVVAAQVKCVQTPNFGALAFETGVEKKLPDRRYITGDVHWMATDKGVVRFGWTDNRVQAYGEARTGEVNGRRVYSLRGKTGVRNMVFTPVESRLGTADAMVDNRTIYLRCVGSEPPAAQSESAPARTDGPASQ